ncbi:transposase [Bacteroidetes bacterium endosymbiont of Geopemphigus sp.]|uniref:transposase n=1 Tax=Bacteroidetes bacterium endosymbiont of Geopemphigus sp. TaxID=2047937 RepID=UPI000CD22D66|nr:transposase [Bacteroidetes bacterium endosymbiont of Geopemphigus sp.]
MINSNAQISLQNYIWSATRGKVNFFEKLNKLSDWGRIEKEIRKNYQKGVGLKGQPAYSGLSLFKILLLSHWYTLSDTATEEMVKESISCTHFCGFRLEDQIPDHTTLCSFRNELVSKKSYERLFKKINEQLEKTIGS